MSNTHIATEACWKARAAGEDSGAPVGVAPTRYPSGSPAASVTGDAVRASRRG